MTAWAIVTSVLYVALALWLMQRLRTAQVLQHRHLLLALIPALLQGWLLHLAIDTGAGQNLGLAPMAGMVSWLIVLLLLLPAEVVAAPLLVIALFIAAICVQLVQFIPPTHLLPLSGHWSSLAHIFSALAAYSLLLVAAVQALMLMILERRLRAKQHQLSPFFPPLTLQETFLFRLLALGFGLLTLSILIAAFGLRDLLASQPVHKTVFVILSWMVFAVLLLGRWQRGWRGALAVRWTLLGFALLALGYAGTRFVLEFILHKV